MLLKDHLTKNKRKIAKNRFLHGPNHVLADELATKLKDTQHFGLYLKFATQYNHTQLRGILGQVLENPKIDNPGKLFTYLVKQQIINPKSTNSHASKNS